jgi:Na+:H+ antiporter
LALRAALSGLVERVNFPQTFLNGALSLLLFAGAFHVDLDALWHRKWRVLVLATVGVVVATALFGVGMYSVFRWWAIDVPLIWCFVLGSIVAPTDPVAVLGVLRRVGLEPEVQATIAGESLFNDGVGVVVFSILLATATGTSTAISGAEVLASFVLEAVGGAVLGLAAGYVAFLAMRSIDKYDLELMISLALVMVTYSVAGLAHLSGPIAVAVAGLLIGHYGTRQAMSEATREHVEAFWLTIDEILNALLFLLIGVELVAIDLSGSVLGAAGAAIALSFATRAVSVSLPTLAIAPRMPGKMAYLVALTWAGCAAAYRLHSP